MSTNTAQRSPDPIGPPPVSLSQRDRLRRWVVLDLVMMGLLLLNLLLLTVEALYGVDGLRRLMATHLPTLQRAYANTIHQHVTSIDLAFVGVYLLELLLRWIVSVRRREYERWYVYPLIHWYDVIGCVPIGSLRFLRVLRAVAIVVRLHRLGLIDLRRGWLYRVFDRYRRIVTEEISDRVVVRVLDGIQREIEADGDVVERLWREVVEPRKRQLLQVTGEEVQAQAGALAAEHTQEVRDHVERLLQEALDRERMISIEALPVVGKPLTREVERTIRRVVDSVVRRVLEEVPRIDGERLVATLDQGLRRRLRAGDGRLADEARAMGLESLEILKDQVRIKQWKRPDPRRAEELEVGASNPSWETGRG